MRDVTYNVRGVEAAIRTLRNCRPAGALRPATRVKLAPRSLVVNRPFTVVPLAAVVTYADIPFVGSVATSELGSVASGPVACLNVQPLSDETLMPCVSVAYSAPSEDTQSNSLSTLSS